LLDRVQEKKLAICYWHYKDKKAAYQLITSNLLLVVKLVMEFRIQHQNIMDYIQEGNIGLMEVLKRFDPYRNFRFNTYAIWWIKAYILKYIIQNWRLFKIGTTNQKRKLFFNLQKEKAHLEAMGINPDAKILAERLGSNEPEINTMMKVTEQVDLSLDAPREQGDGTAFIDILRDEMPSVEDQMVRKQFLYIVNGKVEKFKKNISERERSILEDRLMGEKPATLKELSARFHKTKEAVRYTEKNLVKKLKVFFNKELPDLHRTIGF
jgi:RNA polymerase sigma-32 factor